MNLKDSVNICYCKLIPPQLRYLSNHYLGYFTLTKLYKDPMPDLPIPLLSLLNKDDIVIEVGTNTGKQTECMARRVKMVYTFEPNPAPLKIAKKHVKQKNVVFYNEAIDRYTGTMKLHLHSKYSGSNSIYSGSDRNILSFVKTITIKVISLDDFILSSGITPTILIMDAEGSEANIIRYSKHLPDRIFTETHLLSNGVHTEPICKELLISKGYNIVEFIDKSNMVWLKATK